MLKQLKVVGDVSIQDVYAALHEVICSGHYSIKPRFMLEKSTTELHFIPYIKITNRSGDRVMVYQRPARDDGEARLDGQFSIGLGGHPDSKAFQYDNHVLTLEQSLWNAAWSEFIQEIRIEMPGEPSQDGTGRNSIDITETAVGDLKSVGFIYDPSDDVGLTHVAVLFEVTVSDKAIFVPNSPTEVREPHWEHIGDIVRDTKFHEGQYENWSRLLVKHAVAGERRKRFIAHGADNG
jgi:predicted NUDIX family phosphoesterase